jgi:hypothetical protein
MKTSGAAITHNKARSRGKNSGEGSLFVLVIDRKKVIKQLLEAVGNPGLSFERKN